MNIKSFFTRSLSYDCKRQVKALGFSLVELMVAIAVLAIIIAIAVPSFVQQVQRTQMRGVMADFITAIAYARSQAVTRGQSIHVYATSTDWGANGWCVTTSSSSCGSVSTSLLREFDGPDSVIVTGDSGTQLYSFDSQGHLSSTSSHISICGSSQTGKKIRVLPLGQALAQDCSCDTATKQCS